MLQDFCRKTYNLELEYNATDDDATNAFFFKTLGSGHFTSIFFDNIEDGWLFRKKKLLKEFTQIEKVVELKFYLITIKTVSYMLTVVAYYLDLFKDIMLAHRLYSFFPDRLPIILFSVTVGCIILCEFTKMVVVLNFSPWTKTKSIIGSIFIW